MRFANAIVADHRVEIAVIVQIDQARTVVFSIRPPKRITGQQVFVEPFLRFAKVEELDLLTVRSYGIVDELDELRAAAPAVWVEDEGEDTLLQNGDVQCGFPVREGHGIR